MKRTIALLATLTAAGFVQAQEEGKVLSSTPVIKQVGVQRRVCSTDQVAVAQPNSGAGALVGAIVGGALGNASGGRGAGQAAATVIGAVGGSIVGDRIEGTPEPQVRDVQRCGVQTIYENRAVGYNVVYEYAGKQYTVQMPQDPGPVIRLQVTPVGMASAANAPAREIVTEEIVESRPAAVIQSPTVYREVYVQPYYPPVGIVFGVGGWGHRRWH
jgi:uncharacterized protein YcfJ